MALVKCPECGAAVSSLATSCPKCGSPIDGANLQPITSVPSTPSVSVPITISWKALLNGFMMVLGLTALILVSVCCSNRNNPDLGTIRQASYGFRYSMLALFFLIVAVKKNSTEYERILGWFGSGLSLLLIIFDLHFHFGWNTTALNAVIGLIIVAYAFTVQDYSKYIALAAGILMVASTAYDTFSVSFLNASHLSGNEMIALGSVAGIGYIVLMGYWSAVAYAAQNKPVTRFLAVLQSVLMLTTIIIGSVCFQKCLNGNVGSMQLVLVFAILSGMTGLLLAFILRPSKMVCVLSVLSGLVMLFILLRIYPEIYYNAVNYDYSYNYYDSYDYSYSNDSTAYMSLMNHDENLGWTSSFMLPFFIMFTYLARMTGNLRNRLSIQVNVRS